LIFSLIHTNLSTIKRSKIEYTADYYRPLTSDLSSMLLRISKVLLLKQNQQIANSTNCNEVVDNLISLRKKYPDFVINGEKQLSLMKGNWGGIGTTPLQCPSWQMWQVISNNT
jgi:hypothetical protein